MAVLAPPWRGAAVGRALPRWTVPRAEWLCALLLIGALSVAGSGAVRLYSTAITPTLARPSVPAAPRGVPADDHAAVERFQLVNDLLGEAIAYRNTKNQEWADATLARILTLDPINPTALLLEAQWAAEPPPPLTEAEATARAKHEQLMALLGAAASLREAGMQSEAALLLEEAAALS